MDVNTNTIVLSKVFAKWSYDGKAPLTIAIGALTNYEAVSNIGPWIVSAYAIFDDGKYMIDQGSVDNIVTLTPGLGTGIKPIECNNPRTYSHETIYKFFVVF